MRPTSFDAKLQQFAESSENLDMMQELGLIKDPVYRNLWECGNAPLPAAPRLRARLRHALLARLIDRRLQPPAVQIPAVPRGEAIAFGADVLTGRPILIPRERLGRHLIIVGMTGIGKTTLLVGIIRQLLAQGVTVVFADHKGEGRRLLALYPDALVIRADQEPVNLLDPVGPPETYWSAFFFEVAKTTNLRVETYNELPELLVRVQRGLARGDPFPSLQDLVEVLFRIASRERRPKLATVARALRGLNAVLGTMSRVRRAPDLVSRSRLLVREYQGLPPRIHNLLSAAHLLRVQSHGAVTGHGVDLRHVYVSDEGLFEFGREMASEAGSGYVRANKRWISQVRSQGDGVIVALQMLSELDESVKSNAATLCTFRCPNLRDAQEAQAMLGLPAWAARQIMTLPVGRAFVRSDGFGGAVLVDVPHTALGRYLGDAEVAQVMGPKLAQFERECVLSPLSGSAAEPIALAGETVDVPPAPTTAERPTASPPMAALTADEQSLITAIGTAQPGTGTTDLYRLLNWTFRRGNKAKQKLLARRLIRIERQESRNGRPREFLIANPSPP